MNADRAVCRAAILWGIAPRRFCHDAVAFLVDDIPRQAGADTVNAFSVWWTQDTEAGVRVKAESVDELCPFRTNAFAFDALLWRRADHPKAGVFFDVGRRRGSAVRNAYFVLFVPLEAVAANAFAANDDGVFVVTNAVPIYALSRASSC